MRRRSNAVHHLLSFAFLALLVVTSATTRADTVAIRAKSVYVGDGTIIENGVVVVTDGRITAVGRDVAIPEGAKVIETSGAVTAGLIDANARLEPTDLVDMSDEAAARSPLAMILNPHNHDLYEVCDDSSLCPLAEKHTALAEGQFCPVCGGTAYGHEPLVSGVESRVSLTEASSEVVPHTFVIDSINLRSPDFDRLVAGGVTTVYASPDTAAVIGPRGAVLRTAGPVSQRIEREADAVQATLSSDTWRVGGGNSTPSRFRVTNRARRPNSRMGLSWVFRKAMSDADRVEQGLPLVGADSATETALREVSKVKTGEIPLRVLARQQNDIEMAFRFAEQFGLKFTLLEATEAYKCVDEIKAAGTPVVFGPIFIEAPGVRATTGEARDSRLSTIKSLLDADVPLALSAQDLRDEDGLARQAMYAMRAGLDRHHALRLVTSAAAEMIGLADEIGTIQQGKRADLVVWSGEPFDATSKPAVVLINGEVVVDHR